MIVDARSVPFSASLQTDLCIVGAGAAGMILAREFIGQNVQVCLLESGGASPDPETQSLAFGENVGFPYYSLDTARSRCVGGSSTRWHIPIGGGRLGVRLRPLDAIDFEARSWVPYSGWPFDKQHLNPFYDRAQAICRVEPATYRTEDWEDPEYRPRLRIDGEDVQTVIFKFGCRDLFVHDYPTEVSKAENIGVFQFANVLEVLSNPPADRITKLQVRTLSGNQFAVVARAYVLAAGGIETPRLLLMSNRTQTCGLGNQNDLVGRFFMEHPHFWSGILVPSTPDIFRSTGLYNGIHTVNGVPIVGKLALTEKALRREQLLNQNVELCRCRVENPFAVNRPSAPAVQSVKALCTAILRGEKVAAAGRHVRNILTGFDDVAAAGVRRVRDRVRGVRKVPVFCFAQMMEQVPNPESRVTLGSQRDRFNQPCARLNWQITPQDMRSALRSHQIIAAALERVGLGRFFRQMHTESPPPNTEGGYHHMGTTRMHLDPKQGVVDANSRVHGISNLYIAGPSVFPTGGYANPVLTLLALTIRLADHLKRALE